ncbi:MAG: helix-turn-helix domain-containing protein, partial [Promethearchaeota archaeon]
MTEKPNYQDKEWLYKQYIVKKKSSPEIAEICNVSSTTIKRWLEKLMIPIRTLSEASQLKS